MLRVTAALLLLTASAHARPPFPYEGRLRLVCECSGLESATRSYEATTCMLGADLHRAGPASLIIDFVGSEISDTDLTSRRTFELGTISLGLDLNFGRRSGTFGVELLYRMALTWARDTATLDAQWPFAYGGMKIGVGWRWVELGGTPFPRPGEPRLAHLAYGLDLHNWVVLFGLGLFSATVVDGDRLVTLDPEFATYGEILGRFGDFDLGVRAALGGFQSLTLVVAWRMSLL